MVEGTRRDDEIGTPGSRGFTFKIAGVTGAGIGADAGRSATGGGSGMRSWTSKKHLREAIKAGKKKRKEVRRLERKTATVHMISEAT